MNKNKFLNGLKKSLKALPSKEIEEIVTDYNSYFDEGIQSGKTESEVLEALGDYKSIARQHKENYIDKEIKGEKFLQHIFRTGIPAFGVAFFNLIFVLGPVVAIIAIIFALFCGSLGIVAIGVLMLLSAVDQTFLSQWIYIPSISDNTIFELISSIGTIAIGLLLFIGSYYLSKAVRNWIKKYIKWNLRIINWRNIG